MKISDELSIIICISALCIILFLIGFIGFNSVIVDAQDINSNSTNSTKKIDDWNSNAFPKRNEVQVGQQKIARSMGSANSLASPNNVAESVQADSLGLSTGGAKDANNFYRNIQNGFMPNSDSITYEGVFYNYHFDVKSDIDKKCESLFCPKYDMTIEKDPFSQKENVYLNVGLDSGLKAADFKRPNLDLVVVLDISGSMGSSFNKYYNSPNAQPKNSKNSETKRKIEVAKQALADLATQLNPEDRFGIVLYHSNAFKAKPLRSVAKTDMKAISTHIREDIYAIGGTNMYAGMSMASEMLKNDEMQSNKNRSKHIIFLTDAMPNVGPHNRNNFIDLSENNAKNGIYTTFIGIGLDFNANLVDSIGEIKGANYYSVHNNNEFYDRMVEQFDFMVTPLAFDLQLQLQAKEFDIEKVYGVPSVDKEEQKGVAEANLFEVKTLFPSPTTKEGSKGSVILVKLKPNRNINYKSAPISLKAFYETLDGKKHVVDEKVKYDKNASQSTKKAILLSQYVDIMKTWALHDGVNGNECPEINPMPKPLPEKPIILQQDNESQVRNFNTNYYNEIGIPTPGHDYTVDDNWQKCANQLNISTEYEKIINIFKNYFTEKAHRIETSKQDKEQLEKELDTMKSILDAKKSH